MNTMTILTATLIKEDDLYIATCQEIGTTSQGKTIEQAIQNLKEATELYLEEFPAKKPKHVLLTTFEVSDSAKA